MSGRAGPMRERSRATWIAWAVALPFLLLVLATVAMPFAWRGGEVLLACVRGPECAGRELVADRYYLRALLNTVWLSAGSTLIALAVGTSAAVAIGARPRLHRVASVLASLGANFAGVPLALALTLLFGAQGVISGGLARAGLALPFDLYGLSGLFVAYLCFQVPLATLMLMPAVAMGDDSLHEAAATLGARPALYWRRVGLPLLAPSLVEVGSVLFANAAAAYATPFALSGTAANVLAVRIAALVSGDIFAQPELAMMLALAMFALLMAVIGGGRMLAARWRARLES
jgi:putative spermidine/putrescine transport system permease protein